MVVNTVWDLAGSPYTISKNDFEVADGVTLTIEEGITVVVSASFTVRGQLIVNGADGSRVLFTGDNWGRFQLIRDNTAETSTIRYADFEHLDYQGILIEDESVVFENTTFTSTVSSGNQVIKITQADEKGGASVQFSDCQFVLEHTASSLLGSFNGFVITGMPTTFINSTVNLVYSVSAASFVGVLFTATDAILTMNDVTWNQSCTDPGAEICEGFRVLGTTPQFSNTDVTLTVTNGGKILVTNSGAEISGGNWEIKENGSGAFYNPPDAYHLIGVDVTGGALDVTGLSLRANATQHRNLSGFRNFSGSLANSRIRLSATHNNSAMFGITAHAGSNSSIINNTMTFSSDGGHALNTIAVSSYALQAGRTLTIRNNIFQGTDKASSTGVSLADTEGIVSHTGLIQQFLKRVFQLPLL